MPAEPTSHPHINGLLPAVTVHDISLTGFADQHGEYLRDLRVGRKEPFTAELFRNAVGPGAIVVDGGAYVGYYTLIAAQRAGTDGQVTSFEPHPRSYRCLRRNLRDNRLSAHVSARQACLGDCVGTREFHLAGGDGSESSMFVPRRPAGSQAVPCTSLDMARNGGPSVDVIKLDVEGGEVIALRGMRRTLAESPAVTLFVEYNPRALRRAGFRPDELLTELEAASLQISVIDERERRLAAPEEIEALTNGGGPGHVNLYCRGPQIA